MAKALSGLFAAGATLALLTLLLPHGSQASDIGLLGVVANAYLTAAWLFARADDIGRRHLPSTLASGTLHITAVAYFSGQAPSPLVFFYLWVFLYSAYFFSGRETIVQVVFTGLAYATLLGVRPPDTGPAAWWVVGIGTLLVAAILILAMRRRVELLMEQLFDAARTDALTLLTNRRGFREALDLDLERARRGESAMTVLVGDLDHFKDVNDRAGHHGGDQALRRVAAVLDSHRRQIDTIARVGGEEFALILPDTDAAGAFVVAERLRTEIRGAFADDLVPLTISFGIATYPGHGQTPGALLRTADEALYGAKESGRNRTVVHSPETRTALAARGGRRDVEGDRYLAVVLDLAEAVDLRFSGSARHCETVGRYVEMMAGELQLPAHRIGRIRLAGILHDIGKVGVPDAILRKPGPLTEEEWAAMHRHPGLGAQILEHESLADVRGWVGAHHERPDGRGYPSGIGGAELGIEPRILAVADAYEAMTSDRSYRVSIGPEAARAELRRGSGTQFDARAAKALLTVLDREARLARAA
jgi:diguanylate cyclase (GGDEF)-like protein